MAIEMNVPGNNHEMYKGKKLLKVTTSGLHVVEVDRRGKNKAVVSNFDNKRFANLIQDSIGEIPERTENRRQLLDLVTVSEIDGIPYRTFLQGRHPYDLRSLRRTAGSKIQIAVEFPVEPYFYSTPIVMILDPKVEHIKPLVGADWRELDKRKRKLKSEYDKMKKAWRKSFENK